jgi:HAE1 family hydrophobic/amphiphilic exporter-1
MGALPVAFGSGAGSAARKPLGYAIVGGVFFSTALTLFVVPVAYVVFDSLFGTARARRAARLEPVAGEGD